MYQKPRQVLIESDWNLKDMHSVYPEYLCPSCINRIRLEFKGFFEHSVLKCPSRINRIRLEFKVDLPFLIEGQYFVLIESDWNLKLVIPQIIVVSIQY